MKLVSPSKEFESAFKVYYQDFLEHDIDNSDYYKDGVLDFSRYIECLDDEARGVNLPDGYVPCNHYWLVSDEGEILGAIRVRHRIDNEFLSLEAGHIGYDIAPSKRGSGYGKAMIKFAIPKASSLGIKQALITADEDNIASRKVIEANGGKFEKIVFGKVFPGPVARYWLDCQ
ncbi:Acetyltransferase [Vibrio chagasii]|uniref:GNAT family N-acetyltransferase n=1 Tax=Vibrio TaxID=662 RepID=UPI00076A2CE4|nr:GNAT family N-acetyltransferase [Vibrio splendidus]CAH6841436.1 Acetyltransferase [Vibrio chagasii]CAH6843204.1 Acetyltransferase [Vibrio chagasii]CAH6886812.1 Acetyltransferase [Vibrio chagasii]CAH7060636.1 Acetyltransferase [Vibrio chagasii]CAH7100865.1 Acetyltransferase [Vibrio chagasii]